MQIKQCWRKKKTLYFPNDLISYIQTCSKYPVCLSLFDHSDKMASLGVLRWSWTQQEGEFVRGGIAITAPERSLRMVLLYQKHYWDGRKSPAILKLYAHSHSVSKSGSVSLAEKPSGKWLTMHSHLPLISIACCITGLQSPYTRQNERKKGGWDRAVLCKWK